ncbi:hypothetical protein CDL12_05743 [Handroanthus impetiginosus]|uniref:F-box domain-containing protein n=1 Tax=Handroanthus impetiginosus TaxID=429701 RepID=A0A2G9HVL5_9LAMI|nr:hypothetical protein CDL12_05743 [Handroanthus impetiginosus]
MDHCAISRRRRITGKLAQATTMEALPEECLSHVISFTSPRDACRSALVSGIFRGAADSDIAWEKFLPLDYLEIISRSISPVEYSSKKELFIKLSSAPLLIDGGNKTFLIDKYTNKKCYMLSARELSISWSTNSLCWCWKPLAQSRFPEAVELIMVCWLEIRGKINTKMLSPNTTYGAYLVFQLAHRAFGLGVLPSKVSVEVGDYKTQGTLCLNREECKMQVEEQQRERVLCPRDDGWLEVELGEFYNGGSEKEVKMEFRETKGEQLKGGLVVEGIELRPKQ